MNPVTTALSGMAAAGTRLANSANNIANLNTTGESLNGVRLREPYQPTDVVQSSIEPQGGVRTQIVPRTPDVVEVPVGDGRGGDTLLAPNVSLEEEAVQQQMATYTFDANLKSLKTYDEMIGSLLDIAA